MSTVVIDKIVLRRGSATQWANANPILAEGEPGYDTTNKKQKIGDGITPWNSLPFQGGDSGGPSDLPDGQSYEYFRGDKTLGNFASAVLGVALAGISFVSALDVSAVDTVLGAFGKVQAQLSSLKTTKADLASPAFTGNPTVPNQAAGNNSTRAANTAYVDTAIANLINSAPGALDTLGELAAQMAADESAVASLTTTVAGKLAKASNLSDLTNPASARTNLGLGNVENTAISTWAGSANITTLGTIGTGTWQGGLVAGQYGGTGVNNSGKTLTLGGNFATSGAFATTLTVTGTTNVTLPTTGTLATISDVNAVIPSQTGNSGKYLTTNGTTLSWATVSGGGGASSPLTLTASNASEVPLTLKLYATSPTGNFLDFKTNGGTILTSVDKDGLFCSAESTSNVHYGATGTKTGMQIREAQSAGGKLAFFCHYYPILYIDRGSYSGGADAVRTTSTGQFQFTSTLLATDSADTGLARSAAGVVKVTNGSTGFGKIALSNATPTSSSDSGTAQSLWADANYIYVQTGATTIKRVALSAF